MCLLSLIILLRSLLQRFNNFTVLSFLHLGLLLFLLNLLRHEGNLLKKDSLLFTLLVAAKVGSHAHVVHFL